MSLSAWLHMSDSFKAFLCFDNKGAGAEASAEIHFDPVFFCYTALRVWNADL